MPRPRDVHAGTPRRTSPPFAARAGLALVGSAVLIGGAITAAPSARAATVPTTTTTIHNVASGLCIDAAGSGANGSLLKQWGCSGNAAQTFRIVDAGSGYVSIRLGGGSQALDVKDYSTADGAAIQFWAYGSGSNQQWQIVQQSNGNVAFKSRQTGKCLDVPSGARTDGLALQQWGCNFGPNQQFNFGKAGGGTTMPPPSSGVGLDSPAKKEMAQKILSTSENSSYDWRAQFAYIEWQTGIGDDRGYTGGIVGFTSRTGDMLELVENYVRVKPSGNLLAPYLQALRNVNGTSSDAGLGSRFMDAWRASAADPVFQNEQVKLRDVKYFNPAVNMAKGDGLGALGQFIYYDAIVVHGSDPWGNFDPTLETIRKKAMAEATLPSRGGDQATYLKAFLKWRRVAMQQEPAHASPAQLARVDRQQLPWVNDRNFDLNPPISWWVNGQGWGLNS